MKRLSLLLLGALAVVGVAWLATRSAQPTRSDAGEAQGGTPLPSSTVTVILVRDRAAVRSVREVIAEDRILANSLDGFVVREGRIVTSSVEAVSELLALAGWSDAKLELVKPAARSLAVGPAPAPPSPRDAEMSALRAKQTLTSAEAERALELLEWQ